jgi:hypothetical protein
MTQDIRLCNNAQLLRLSMAIYAIHAYTTEYVVIFTPKNQIYYKYDGRRYEIYIYRLLPMKAVFVGMKSATPLTPPHTRYFYCLIQGRIPAFS